MKPRDSNLELSIIRPYRTRISLKSINTSRRIRMRRCIRVNTSIPIYISVQLSISAYPRLAKLREDNFTGSANANASNRRRILQLRLTPLQ